MQPRQLSIKQLLFPLCIVLVEVAVYLSNDMYLPALPKVQYDLRISSQAVQMTLTYWFVGTCAPQLLLGPIADWFGRRPVLLIGSFIFIIASLICAYSHYLEFIYIARFLQGASLCAVLVAGYAAIHESFMPKDAIRIIAFMGSITILAPAFGPMLGVWFLQFTDWQAIFLVVAALAGLGLLGLYHLMPEHKNFASKQPVGSLKIYWRNYGEICRNINFMSYTITYCAIFCGLIIWVCAGAFMVMNIFRLNIFYYALIQLCVFGSFIVGNMVVKYLVNMTRLVKIVPSGIGGVFLAVICMLLSATLINYSLFGFTVGLMLYAFATGLLFSPLQRLAIEACVVPMAQRVAVFFFGVGLACVLGSLLVIKFFDQTLWSLSLMLLLLFFISTGSYFTRVIVNFNKNTIVESK